MNIREINIIQLADKMFDRYGIRSVSVDDICRELRLSKKTFYKIIPNKEALVANVLDYRAQKSYQKFKKMGEGRNAIDTMVMIIKEIKKDPEDVKSPFHYDLEKYYPDILAKHQEKKTEEMRAGFEQNLRQGIEEGYYREDLDVELSALFHAVILKDSFASLKDCAPKIKARRLGDFYIDIIVRLISNEKGLKYIEKHT